MQASVPEATLKAGAESPLLGPGAVLEPLIMGHWSESCNGCCCSHNTALESLLKNLITYSQ